LIGIYHRVFLTFVGLAVLSGVIAAIVETFAAQLVVRARLSRRIYASLLANAATTAVLIVYVSLVFFAGFDLGFSSVGAHLLWFVVGVIIEWPIWRRALRLNTSSAITLTTAVNALSIVAVLVLERLTWIA
jgi:hypothetical protein